jgi:hypothetical protein
MSLAGAPGLGEELGAPGWVVEEAAGAGDRPCKQHRNIPNRISVIFFYFFFYSTRLMVFLFCFVVLFSFIMFMFARSCLRLNSKEHLSSTRLEFD